MFETVDRMPDRISQSGVHFMLHFQMMYKTGAISAPTVARACTFLRFGICFYAFVFRGCWRNKHSVRQTTIGLCLILS
jgi:hypothetical protein